MPSLTRKGLVVAALGVTVGALTTLLPSSPARAQFTVFDPSNYTQNLLTAARTLQQVNNQIRSLQNEATMLLNQAKNLERIDFPELRQLDGALQQIDRLMSQAQGLGFDASGLDQRFARLFPQGSTQAEPFHRRRSEMRNDRLG